MVYLDWLQAIFEGTIQGAPEDGNWVNWEID